VSEDNRGNFIDGNGEHRPGSRRWLWPALAGAALAGLGLWAIFGPGPREADEAWYWWVMWLVAPAGSLLGLAPTTSTAR